MFLSPKIRRRPRLGRLHPFEAEPNRTSRTLSKCKRPSYFQHLTCVAVLSDVNHSHNNHIHQTQLCSYINILILISPKNRSVVYRTHILSIHPRSSTYPFASYSLSVHQYSHPHPQEPFTILPPYHNEHPSANVQVPKVALLSPRIS
jgi:hypothetical protein